MEQSKITSERIVYIDKCVGCGRIIKGFSPENLRGNMLLHLEKEVRQNKQEKENKNE